MEHVRLTSRCFSILKSFSSFLCMAKCTLTLTRVTKRKKGMYSRCVPRLWCIMVLIYVNQNVGASVVWFTADLYLRAIRSLFESWANHFWGACTICTPQSFKSFGFFPFIIIIIFFFIYFFLNCQTLEDVIFFFLILEIL